METSSAEDLDKELLAQLHNATLKASDVCFEMKKLCATVLVPTVALVSVFSDRKLNLAVFSAAFTVIGCFWLADSVGYYYQRKLRVAMGRIWIRRANRSPDEWTFRPPKHTPVWRALLNGSMTFYLKLAARELGEPYIDDLHHDESVDRHEHVHSAMDRADAFLMVLTENYLQTLWTNLELDRAEKREVPIFKLQDGRITASKAEEVRELAKVR